MTCQSQKHQDQEFKKNARLNGDYDQIWKNTNKCVFCDLKEKYILLEENEIVLAVNLYPYIDGQLMAIPRQHVRSPKELTPAQWETMRKFSYLAKKMLKKIYGYKGLWTLIREGGGQAQMTVSDHLHMQFIPFDKSSLCQWNYRQLKNTPLENTQKFKEQKKLMTATLKKFEKKYQ
jgi:diadenosine tetraphosphate (Ap4A) HIT family hydrolase